MIDLEVMTRAAYTYCTCQCYHTLCSIPACCPLLQDIVGFTTMSKEVQPFEVMSFLNSLFTLFDEVIDQYSVFKVMCALADALAHQIFNVKH